MKESVKEKDEFVLEEAFEKLETILKNLESSEITLEQSFQMYKEGMDLLKQCNENLDTVEKKMQMINEEGEYIDFQ
ncbi:MAG: exodeoxyribonuclease VII small subunit [Muricoprocola sp.]